MALYLNYFQIWINDRVILVVWAPGCSDQQNRDSLSSCCTGGKARLAAAKERHLCVWTEGKTATANFVSQGSSSGNLFCYLYCWESWNSPTSLEFSLLNQNLKIMWGWSRQDIALFLLQDLSHFSQSHWSFLWHTFILHLHGA